MSNRSNSPAKVFISYSHDSASHRKRILKFSDYLRNKGIDAYIDQYEAHPVVGWPRWMWEGLEEADFVLMIITQNYEKEAKGKGSKKGVNFEGHMILNYLYKNQMKNDKFLLVVFESRDQEFIPLPLQGYPYYQINIELADLMEDPNFDSLYRRLTGQPKTIKPAIGKMELLATHSGTANLRVLIIPTVSNVADPDWQDKQLEVFKNQLSQNMAVNQLDFYPKNATTSEEVYKSINQIEPDILHFWNYWEQKGDEIAGQEGHLQAPFFFLAPNDIFKVVNTVLTQRETHLKGAIIHGNYSLDQVEAVAKNFSVIGVAYDLSQELSTQFFILFYKNYAEMKNIEHAFVESAFKVIETSPVDTHNLLELVVNEHEKTVHYRGLEGLETLKKKLKETGEQLKLAEEALTSSSYSFTSVRKGFFNTSNYQNLAEWMDINKEGILDRISSEVLPNEYNKKREAFRGELDVILDLLDNCLVKMSKDPVLEENIKDIFGGRKFKVPNSYYTGALESLVVKARKENFRQEEMVFFEEIIDLICQSLLLLKTD